MKKTLKAVTCEIKDINEEERSFLAVASTEDIDRDGDRIMADGWDVANFLRNPVIPWAHRYGEPPVARALEISVQDGRLMFRPKFPKPGEYPFADTIWKLYRGGFLKAFSVGFMPRRWESVDRGKGLRGRDYIEQELWEISACTVPSNPNALVAAKSAGVITDEEAESMAQGEEAKDAAPGPDPIEKLIETLSPLVPLFAGIEKKLDAVSRKLEEGVLKPQPETAPDTPAAAIDPGPGTTCPGPSPETLTPETLAAAVGEVLQGVDKRIRDAVAAEVNYHLGKVN